MNISSVIVIPSPERIEDVRRQLEEVPGVEIHGISPEGKMVVVIEVEDDRATTQTFEHISQLDGVLSAAMVYHQQEPDPETEITVEA